MFFVVFLFFLSLFCIFIFGAHYIYILLLVESLLLSVFLFMGYFFGFYSLGFLFYFLLFLVCLGAFSISLLVSLVRFSGRDFWGVQSF